MVERVEPGAEVVVGRHRRLAVLDADDQDDPGEFETTTDGYTRWDAGADYRWAFNLQTLGGLD